MKKALGSAGVPGWMVTFADLMALMMTFFVLLYSFSNTDEGKYKVVVESMAHGFGTQWIESPNQNLGETGPQPGVIQPPNISLLVTDKKSDDTPEPEEDITSQAKYQVEFERFSTELADDINDGMLTLENQSNQLIISFPEQTTFTVGSEILNPDSIPSLDRIAHLIEDTEGDVVISGHTDDIPIRSDRFRSNWELSSSRAVSVVHALTEHVHQLSAVHITVEGHADTHPLAPNDSDENRAKNRRVEITVIIPENDEVTAEPELL